MAVDRFVVPPYGPNIRDAYVRMNRHALHVGNPTYCLRAWDAGGGMWVYWRSQDVEAMPAASQTDPPYSGALSAKTILAIL